MEKITRKYLIENGYKEWPSTKRPVGCLLSKETLYTKDNISITRECMIDMYNNGKAVHDGYMINSSIISNGILINISTSGDNVESIDKVIEILEKIKD